MSKENQEVEKLEKEFKSKLFEVISELSSKLNELMTTIQKTGKYVDLETDLPNMGVTLNNKLNEMQREFQKAGLSLYSQYNEKYDFVEIPLIGEAIIEDLMTYVAEGQQKLSDYNDTSLKILTKKDEPVKALEKVSPLRRMFAKIKNLFAMKKQQGQVYKQEEVDEMNTYLSDYKDIDNKLYNYNLRDNIVPAIVKKLRQHNAYAVPGILEESIAPDLEKLGLSDLIPEIQENLIEEYKKDSRNPLIHDLSKLHVPDFNRENKRDGTSLEEVHDKPGDLLSDNGRGINGEKRSLREDGVKLEDLVLIDKTVNASDRQVAITSIHKELQATEEKGQDKTQEDTGKSLE